MRETEIKNLKKTIFASALTSILAFWFFLFVENISIKGEALKVCLDFFGLFALAIASKYSRFIHAYFVELAYLLIIAGILFE